MVILFLFLTFSILVVTQFIPGFQLRRNLPAIGILCLCLGVTMAVETFLLSRRQRRLKVLVYTDKLIKQSGNKSQSMSWEDLERIKIVEKKNGGVAQISFYPMKSKMPVYLFGFSEMEDLASLIEETVPDGVAVQHKRQRLDWRNPLVPMCVSGLPTMVVMCVITWMGPKAIDIFALIAAISIGMGILIFRPLARFDFSYKWLELLAALVLLAISIYVLIHLLLFGTMP